MMMICVKRAAEVKSKHRNRRRKKKIFSKTQQEIHQPTNDTIAETRERKRIQNIEKNRNEERTKKY